MSVNMRPVCAFVLLIPTAAGLTQNSATNQAADEVAAVIRYVVTATNGMNLGILPRAEPFNAKDEIWLFLRTGPPHQGGAGVYAPKNNYLARIELFDTNGLPVAKTDLGRKYTLAPLPPLSARPLTERYSQNRKYLQPDPASSGRRFYWIFSDHWGKFLTLPAPERLFQIQAPGMYRLQLQLQIYARQGTNLVPVPVLFPPLEMPVVQRER